MTRNKKFLIGGLSIAAIAAGAVAASAHRGGWEGHGHGGSHKGHGLMGAVCSGDAAEMADHMLVRLEYKVKPTDAQKGAFEDLKAAARTAAAKAKAACPPAPVQAAEGATPAPRVHKSPIERLGMMETRLQAELDAVRTVRPAAEKFFASLSDEQKAALTAHEDGRGGWGHKGGGREGGMGREDGGREHGHRGWDRHGGRDRDNDGQPAPEGMAPAKP